MSHIAANMDDSDSLVLFAKIPLRLSDSDRVAQFDRPLASSLASRGIGLFLRGFSPVDSDGQVMYIALEISIRSLRFASEFAACLLDLGAPPDSRIEYENDMAAVEFSLAEATGN